MCLTLWTLSVWNATAKRDKIHEARLEQELLQLNPALVEPFRTARVAFDREDYAESERLLREVCAKAPNFDPAFRRLGASLVRQDRRDEGLQFSERAVALNRTADNLTSLAHNLVDGASVESMPANANKAMQLLRECRSLPGGTDADVLAITAQVALILNDPAELRRATYLLRQHYPDTMATHYFTAIEAAYDESWMRAEDEIKAAVKAGLPTEVAQKFLASGVHTRAVGWRIATYAAVAAVAWAVGLVLLYLLGLLLSKITLGHAESADPNIAISGGERKLRRVYRAVLNLAGVYYYLSMPMVVVMVIAIVVAVVAFFLIIGWIPIKLLLLLAIGALVTISAMVRSLFVRVKAEDPGRPLRRDEAPALWEMTAEVARAVDTRPIDEIRITPGTEVSVYERGTWREKLRNNAKRILVLGTGVLNGFKQEGFQCVLAHEYGHFSNRDTAGGDIGLRVRNDIVKFCLAMYHAGQATKLNAAFHFLRIYHFIFRRISHGATRLQEILADRVAAQCYGATALESGLKHVIRRSIEFDAVANAEAKAGVEGGRSLHNLYQLAPPDSKEVSDAYDKAIHRETTDDDTHPSPSDRFRLVAPLMSPRCPSRDGEVWDLFSDREAIMQEMTDEVEKRIAQYRTAVRK